MARGGGGGRGSGGGGGGRGGKGGKGPKPQFTRVIPKFLQQYETMLNGPKPGRGGGGPDDEDAPAMAEPSGMPGQRRNNRDQESGGGRGGEGGAAGGGRGGGGGGGSGGGGGGGAFEDYDEEEVAALEAYMETHPSKEEDKIALRKRARELSASIGSGQGSDAKGGGAQGKRDVSGAGTGGDKGWAGGETPDTPESPIEYTDASGKLKFNKRRAGTPANTGGGGSSVGGVGERGSRDKKKGERKRAKLAKLNNAKLLSFGGDEDE